MSIENSTWKGLDYHFQLTARVKFIKFFIDACLGRENNEYFSDIIAKSLPHTETDEKIISNGSISKDC